MMRRRQLKRRAQSLLTLALCCLAAANCGSSGTEPSGTLTTSDLAGTWVQTDGSRTWTLSAGSTGSAQITVVQVGGPATWAQSNHPTFGSMSAKGGVLGAIVLGVGGFQFTETYEGVSTSLFPFPPNDCYIDTEGQVALSGNTLTGTVTEHDGCNGVRLRDSSSTLSMRRK